MGPQATTENQCFVVCLEGDRTGATVEVAPVVGISAPCDITNG